MRVYTNISPLTRVARVRGSTIPESRVRVYMYSCVCIYVYVNKGTRHPVRNEMPEGVVIIDAPWLLFAEI